jgi:hypothetical protein
MAVNKDKSVQKNITVSKEVEKAIQQIANKTMRSWSNQAAMILTDWLRENDFLKNEEDK